MKKKRWLYLLILGLILCCYIYIVGLLERSYKIESKAANFIIAKFEDSFTAQVHDYFISRVDLAEAYSYNIPKIESLTKEKFEAWVIPLIKVTRGILATNWIDKDGIIKFVYPVEPNISALNQDLKEHPENVYRPYMLRAMESKRTFISHPVTTYRGISALVAYIPIFQDDEFKGWVNFLIEYKTFINEIIVDKISYLLSINLVWQDNMINIFMSPDFTEPNIIHERDIPIRNLKLVLHTQYNSRSLLINYYRTIIFITTVFFALVFYLLHKYFMQYCKLRNMNAKLELHKRINSSLSHDIASPLSILKLVIEQCSGKLEENTHRKMQNSLLRIESLYNSARCILRLSTDSNTIPLDGVHLQSCITTCVEYMNSKASSRGMKITYTPDPKKICVLAERNLLINSVIQNLIENSIKYANPNTEIILYTEVKDGKAYLVVQDSGVGISDADLALLKKDMYLYNEKTEKSGSGLGLQQVYYFMKLFGGAVKFHSIQNQGLIVSLEFQRVLNCDS